MHKSVWSAVTLGAIAAGCVTENGGSPWPGASEGFNFRPSQNAAGHLPETREVVEVPWTEWFFPKPDIENPGRLHSAYARWQEELGNFVEARESYEAALRDDPRSVDAILGLARLDQLAGRPREAERGYAKAVRLRPEDPHVYDAQGEFFASQERWTEAINALHTAMTLSPESKVFRYHLAVALAKAGDVDSALPHFARTVGEAEAHYNISYILYEQGDYDGAERELLLALQMQPNLAEAQRLLAALRGGASDQRLADRGAAPVHREPAPQGWRQPGTQPPTSIDPQRSYLAGYGRPGENRFVPADYPVLPQLSAPIFAEDPRDMGTMRR